MKIDFVLVMFSIAILVIAIGVAMWVASPEGSQSCAMACSRYSKPLKSFSREGDNVKCECGEAAK